MLSINLSSNNLKLLPSGLHLVAMLSKVAYYARIIENNYNYRYAQNYAGTLALCLFAELCYFFKQSQDLAGLSLLNNSFFPTPVRMRGWVIVAWFLRKSGKKVPFVRNLQVCSLAVPLGETHSPSLP